MSSEHDTNSQERVPLKLVIDEKERFKGTIRSEYVTTSTLSKRINTLFRAQFKDYNGCILQPGVDNKPVSLQLDFIPNTDNGMGGVAAFAIKGTSETQGKGSNPLIQQMMTYNRLGMQTSSFEITQDAVDLLQDVSTIVATNLNPSVANFMNSGTVMEYTDSSYNQFGYNPTAVIHTLITCVDINKVMIVMLETSEDKGDKLYYQVDAIKPIYINNQSLRGVESNMPAPSTNYLYSITQLSKKKMDELAEEIGIITSSSMSPVYTGV